MLPLGQEMTGVAIAASTRVNDIRWFPIVARPNGSMARAMRRTVQARVGGGEATGDMNKRMLRLAKLTN